LALNDIGESEPSEPVDVKLPDEEEDEHSQMSSASNEPLHIPRMSRPRQVAGQITENNIFLIFSRPTVSTDGLQTKAILSWEPVGNWRGFRILFYQ
jgi:hypothetical protein